MLEGIAMLTVLAGMGVYFIKSTDIPKDLKDRSAQSRAHFGDSTITSAPTKRYAFDKKIVAETKTEVRVQSISVAELKEKSDAAKLAEIEKHIKRQSLIALQNQKIDELTFLITSLEQEIKENNLRNAEIQSQINVHLETLRLLKESVLA
jgi:hypothetical protein